MTALLPRTCAQALAPHNDFSIHSGSPGSTRAVEALLHTVFDRNAGIVSAGSANMKSASPSVANNTCVCAHALAPARH